MELFVINIYLIIGKIYFIINFIIILIIKKKFTSLKGFKLIFLIILLILTVLLIFKKLIILFSFNIYMNLIFIFKNIRIIIILKKKKKYL